MTEDRRFDRRRDLCRIGLMRIGEDSPWQECLVWDLSESGALIESAQPSLPDEFALTIETILPTRRCLVRRRDGQRYAVDFQPDVYVEMR